MRVKRIMACIGIIVLEGIVLCWLVAGKPKTAPENEQRNASVMPSVGGGAGGEKKDSRKDSDGIVFDRKSPKLVLVNKKNELDPGYDASLRYICNGRLQASRRRSGCKEGDATGLFLQEGSPADTVRDYAARTQ